MNFGAGTRAMLECSKEMCSEEGQTLRLMMETCIFSICFVLYSCSPVEVLVALLMVLCSLFPGFADS